MVTTFVTGSNQTNLTANINLAIASDKLDLTIYSVTPATIGANLDNLIPNLPLLQALRFSDVTDLPNSAFQSANFSDLQTLTGNFSSISGDFVFKQAQMNKLTSISFPNLTSISGEELFHQAQMGALTSINLPNLVSILNKDTFSVINMNSLNSLNLPKLTTISGQGTFFNTQMNALTSLNLSNLTSISGGIGVAFQFAQMNVLTSISWSSTLINLPNNTFSNIVVPRLPGICLGKVTTFNTDTFFNITQGPSDMKALSGKTHNNLVYASDRYGYACSPLVFNIPVGGSDSVFNTYTYKNFAGTTATGLTVTAVNEGPLPATVGSVTIQSNGTITVNSDGPATFTMRFAATSPSSLIGARTVKVNPCFTLSKLKAVTSTNRLSIQKTIGGVSIKGTQGALQSGFRTMKVSAYGSDIQRSISVNSDFSVFFPTSDLTSTQNCRINLSNTSCDSTFSFILKPSLVSSTFLKLSATGSLLDFQLILPSDIGIQSSDKNVIFSDLCAFAQTQPLQRIEADLFILTNSDFFDNEAVITQSSYDVFVSCSDQCLKFNETSNLFAFNICSFTSDAKVFYGDPTPVHSFSDKPTTITSILTFSSDRTVFSAEETTPAFLPCENNLSNIQFTAFSSNTFKVTGYQQDSKPEPRTVTASYINAPTQEQIFNSDGAFEFIFTNTPIINGEVVTITATGSDCAPTTRTIASQFQTIMQGTFTVEFSGSLLNLSIFLPPELAITLPITSDVHTLFSDMCVFAQMQDCHSFLAGIVINAYSDLFCSDAVILQHPEVIVVSCSDNVLHLDDDDGHFTLSITNFMSDTILLQYDDASCHVSDMMSLVAGDFTLQTSDSHFIWVSPCESDVPNTFANVFSHPLLAIDAQGDVVDIGIIDCSPPCHNPTSDLLYASQLKSATLKLGQYLKAHYSDYTSKISDQCQVLYLGPLTADIVTVDFDSGRLIYHNFSIPFSDLGVCD